MILHHTPTSLYLSFFTPRFHQPLLMGAMVCFTSLPPTQSSILMIFMQCFIYSCRYTTFFFFGKQSPRANPGAGIIPCVSRTRDPSGQCSFTPKVPPGKVSHISLLHQHPPKDLKLLPYRHSSRNILPMAVLVLPA